LIDGNFAVYASSTAVSKTDFRSPLSSQLTVPDFSGSVG
jgi:hypothetical protein